MCGGTLVGADNFVDFLDVVHTNLPISVFRVDEVIAWFENLENKPNVA